MKTILRSPSESLRRASCAYISDNDCHSRGSRPVEKHEGIVENCRRWLVSQDADRQDSSLTSVIAII